MPKRSNHARPEDGAIVTSQIRERIQTSPTIDNVNDVLRFTQVKASPSWRGLETRKRFDGVEIEVGKREGHNLLRFSLPRQSAKALTAKLWTLRRLRKDANYLKYYSNEKQ